MKKRLENRLNELNQLILSIYEDKVFKEITEDTFILIINKYENEQREIKESLKKVIECLETIKRNMWKNPKDFDIITLTTW